MIHSSTQFTWHCNLGNQISLSKNLLVHNIYGFHFFINLLWWWTGRRIDQLVTGLHTTCRVKIQAMSDPHPFCGTSVPGICKLSSKSMVVLETEHALLNTLQVERKVGVGRYSWYPWYDGDSSCRRSIQKLHLDEESKFWRKIAKMHLSGIWIFDILSYRSAVAVAIYSGQGWTKAPKYIVGYDFSHTVAESYLHRFQQQYNNAWLESQMKNSLLKKSEQGCKWRFGQNLE